MPVFSLVRHGILEDVKVANEISMNIAIDVRNVGRQRTGSEVVVRELVRALLAQDTRNHYFLLTDTDDPAVHAAIREKCALDGKDNAQIVALPSPNKFVWAAWTVWRFLRRADVDVYHTEYIVPFFVPRRVRVLTHIHDVSFAAHPEYINWKDRLLLRLLIPRSLRRADVVIAVSQFTQDEIVRYYRVPESKVALVPNALPEHFAHTATQQQIAAVRAKYDLPEQYIFSLGTMQPRKNIPFLVAAFARVAHEMPGVALVLSGKRAHNFDRAIDATIARYPAVRDRIVFTGFIDDADVPAVYAGARAFAFPSLYEGFGLPLLEAMSQNVPVVASDIPVFREVAADAAHYASPRDLVAFANALYTVTMCSNDERARMTRAGRARVQAFSWRAAAQALQHLFARNTLS